MFSTFPHMCILFLYPHPYFLSPSLLPVATLTFSLATLPLLMLVPGRRWNLLSSLAKALRWDFYLSLISLIGSHCWRVTAGLPSLSWPAAGSQPKAHVHGGPGTVLLRHRIHPQRASLHPQAWPVPTLLRVCVCSLTSRVSDSVTPRTVACQAPLSMEFSRQEYWNGLPWSSSKGSSWPSDWTCVSCVFCSAEGGPGKPQLSFTRGQLSRSSLSWLRYNL